jgi:hypothetical protein
MNGRVSAQAAGSSHHRGTSFQSPTSIRDRAYAGMEEMEEYGAPVNCQEWPLTRRLFPGARPLIRNSRMSGAASDQCRFSSSNCLLMLVCQPGDES